MNEINTLQTRLQLQNAVANFIQDTSTNRATQIGLALDQGFRTALQRYDWPGLVRWSDAAVTLSAGDAYFHAPQECRNIIAVHDTTSIFDLSELSLRTLATETGGFATLTGGPAFYSLVGDVGINTTFAAATALELLSSAADTRVVTLEGVQSGVNVRSTVTLTGATPAAAGTWSDVTAFYVDSAGAQTVTLRTVTGSTTVAQLLPQNRSVVYRRFRLARLPAANTTLRIIYQYTPPPIFDDSHVYPIPVQGYLFDFALGRMYQSKRQWDAAREHFALAEQQLIWAISEAERNRFRQARVGYISRPIIRTRIEA